MGERCRRPAEQVVRGRQVASGEGAATRGAQVRRRATSERLDIDVGHPQLGADLIRLLEVEAADLLVLEDAVARRRFHPVDESHMELRARPFQEASVGGVADQRVEELERLLADERLSWGPISSFTERAFSAWATSGCTGGATRASTAPR